MSLSVNSATFSSSSSQRSQGVNNSSNQSSIKYIYELPYNVRKSICDLLDADGSWRQLGGEYMNLNDTQLTLISHALLRGASPTNDLLVRWEQSNPKIRQLFTYLATMKHQRAMLLLRPYVEPQLATLCEDSHEEKTVLSFEPSLNFNSSLLKKPDSVSPIIVTEEKIINKEWNNLSSSSSTVKAESVKNEKKETCPSGSSSVQSAMTLDQDELEVPYKELLLSTDDFSEDRIIGSGGFGVVYKGTWKGTQVAIKRLKGCENMSQAVTELKYLNRYRIDNILPLYGISFDGPEACLLYQFMPNGSLEDRLLCKGATPPLTWLQRALIGEGTAKALNYLHTLKGKPLVHGDVKSANVLLDAQFEPKLGDFGLARQISGSTGQGMYTHITVTSVHGTSVYLPPEYLRQKILSPAVDVYSYGIVMLEMATGRRAYDGKRLLTDVVEDELKEGEMDETRKGAIKLRDSKLRDDADGQPWFESLIKLGHDCSNKMKKKRPDMVQILEYYSQCKTRDRIRRLSMESKKSSAASSPTGLNNPDIKSPLELQLWYDMVKRDNTQLGESSLGSPSYYRSQSSSLAGGEFSPNTEDNGEGFAISIPIPVVNQSNLNITSSEAVSGNTESGPNDVIPLLTELGFNNESNLSVESDCENS